MAFLHCHNCSWSQDDFWDESYNPFAYLHEQMEEHLLSEDLDKEWGDDLGTVRDVLANECQKAAKNIRRMKWRTQVEWEVEGKPGCPMCGYALDID
jgi:hypothetical protein